MKAPAHPERFARVAGSPGETPRISGLVRALWPLLLMAIIFGYLLRAAWPHPALPPQVVGLALLALAAVLAAVIPRWQGRISNYLIGARGEEKAARELSFLPADWKVWHGVALSYGGDCDHVVAGPSGLYAVETKNWSRPVTLSKGHILTDGQAPTRPPLEQVRRAAADLQQRLKLDGMDLEVRPVLCFVQEGPEGPPQGCDGVRVCRVHDLRQVVMDDCGQPLAPAILHKTIRRLDQLTQEGNLI